MDGWTATIYYMGAVNMSDYINNYNYNLNDNNTNTF